MGERGPLPDSDRLQDLKGNPRHRTKDKQGPPAPTGIPSCPAQLTGEVLKEWKRITPLLAERGLITALDVRPLIAYCRAVALAERAYWEFETGDDELTDESGNLSPLLRVAQAAEKQMLLFAKPLGMTPAARGVRPQDPKKQSKMSDWRKAAEERAAKRGA